MPVKYPSPRYRRRQLIRQFLWTIVGITLFVGILDMIGQRDDAEAQRAESQQIAGGLT